MTGLKDLLSETAADARVYEVTERALAGGQRRRGRRRAAIACSTAVVVLAGLAGAGLVLRDALPEPTATTVASPSPSPVASAAPRGCDLSKLVIPAPYKPGMTMTAGDPTGRFLAGHTESATISRALLLWDNGQARVLPVHGEQGSIVAVNRNGHAVEVSYQPGGRAQSWVHHDGEWTKLKGQGARAQAINANGAIAGYLERSPDNQVPAVWSSYQADPQLLPEYAEAGTARIWGIDDNGYIVASAPARPQDSSVSPLIWTPIGRGFRYTVVESVSSTGLSFIRIHNGQAVAASSGADKINNRYWSIDLASSQVRGLDLPPGVDHLTADGWGLQPGKASVVFGDTTIPVPAPPDSAGGTHPRYASMSLNGVIGGNGYPPGGAVPLMWRCR